eukprot:COSAG01_NODE_14049_length_1502_cov_1.454027_3_plen_99_part_01
MPEGSRQQRIRADVDKVIGAMEELARSPLRFEELARALFQDDRVPDNVKQDLLPEVHRAITAGVRTRLRFLKRRPAVIGQKSVLTRPATRNRLVSGGV